MHQTSATLLTTEPVRRGDSPQPFDYRPRTRIVFGPGTVEQLGELTRELGGTRVLVASDPGIVEAGHAERGLASLRRAGLEAFLFDQIHPNPTTDDVEAGVEFARTHGIDFLVGLGGGSSMDCAKGINFVFTNGGRMTDYWGTGKAARPMLPMIAVPTTSGTGSETQSFALITDARTHQKMACGDPKASCRIAILDPLLTVSQPASVTAATGVDALAHSLESFVTSRRNLISQAFSREAWRLLEPGFEQVLRQPDDIEARGRMLLGASMAGLAIENSMLGATHALANPLTAIYEIPHGVAIGLMLPHVIRFNMPAAGPLYAELAGLVGIENGTPQGGAEKLAKRVEQLRAAASLPGRLSECEVEEHRLSELAEMAGREWTGRFNPRPVTPNELLELYRCAF